MLFRWGQFTGAGGGTLDWKIECDALDADDWACIANVAAKTLRPFSGVAYVPSSGQKLAKALEPYRISGVDRWLVVDDVWTTGASMRMHVQTMGLTEWIGYVAFARGALPNNVTCFANITSPSPSVYSAGTNGDC